MTCEKWLSVKWGVKLVFANFLRVHTPVKPETGWVKKMVTPNFQCMK